MLDDDPDSLREEQYADDSNLGDRIALHRRYSTAERGWFPWVFDHLDCPDDAAILEVGCGPGKLWAENASRVPVGWDLVLTDFSPGMVESARDALADAGLDGAFGVADVRDLPFGTDRFDAVVANHMLYHVPDDERDGAIAELARVLRPGGALYATTNGEENMADLRALFDRVREGSSPASTAFSRENGRTQLARHFPSVRWHGRDDALAITDPGPVVAYARSSGSLDESSADRLRELVRDRIDSGGGTFRVEKEQGLFVATAGSH